MLAKSGQIVEDLVPISRQSKSLFYGSRRARFTEDEGVLIGNDIVPICRPEDDFLDREKLKIPHTGDILVPRVHP